MIHPFRRSTAKKEPLPSQAHSDVTPIQAVLPGLLPGVIGSISGPAGAGKSWFALALGLELAKRYAQTEGTTKQSVVYVHGQDSEQVVQARLRHLVGLSAPPTTYRTINWYGEDTEDLNESLQYTDIQPQLLILDLWDAFAGFKRHDGRIVHRQLKDFAQDTGCAVLLIGRKVPLQLRWTARLTPSGDPLMQEGASEVQWSIDYTAYAPAQEGRRLRRGALGEIDMVEFFAGTGIQPQPLRPVPLAGIGQALTPDSNETW